MSEVVYEITADVEASIAAEYERYLVDEHIPDLMGTGCFVSAEIARSARTRFRIRYVAGDRADLDRYLAEHADRLRTSALARSPDRVALSREVWEVLKAF